jgi:hypothetical protein
MKHRDVNLVEVQDRATFEVAHLLERELENLVSFQQMTMLKVARIGSLAILSQARIGPLPHISLLVVHIENLESSLPNALCQSSTVLDLGEGVSAVVGHGSVVVDNLLVLLQSILPRAIVMFELIAKSQLQ